jgi:hypothetical protein
MLSQTQELIINQPAMKNGIYASPAKIFFANSLMKPVLALLLLSAVLPGCTQEPEDITATPVDSDDPILSAKRGVTRSYQPSGLIQHP